MGCFNDPAWKVCGWWWGGWLTPTTYNPACWCWINEILMTIGEFLRECQMYWKITKGNVAIITQAVITFDQ